MKRTHKGILALFLALTLAAASGCAAKPEDALYAQGLRLVQTMEEMVQNEAYIAMTTGSSQISGELQPLREGSAGEPEAVYTVTLDENYLSLMGEMAQSKELPKSLRAVAEQRLMSAFVTQINALGGAQKLAASAVCAAGKTFVEEGLEENMVFLYVFRDIPPAAVTFLPGEDGAVSASGMFLLYDGVDYRDEEALRAFFAEMGAELKAYTG